MQKLDFQYREILMNFGVKVNYAVGIFCFNNLLEAGQVDEGPQSLRPVVHGAS